MKCRLVDEENIPICCRIQDLRLPPHIIPCRIRDDLTDSDSIFFRDPIELSFSPGCNIAVEVCAIEARTVISKSDIELDVELIWFEISNLVPKPVKRDCTEQARLNCAYIQNPHSASVTIEGNVHLIVGFLDLRALNHANHSPLRTSSMIIFAKPTWIHL